MKDIHVKVASGEYDVKVGAGLLDDIGSVARASVGGRQAFLVSDSHVMPLYGRRAQASLEQAEYVVSTVTVEAGEAHKSMKSLTGLLEQMASSGLTRDDVVVALGGGMIGDLAGFAAAVYMRGCAVIQIPTSLLAMVDSSVGGKTAVDLDAGKNLAGAFWQPAAVVADTACLRTVSANLLEDSCGEIIKYGVMRDPELFSSLERQPFGISDPHRVEAVVSRCIKLKRDVVAADERESGIREQLNLGHTIGHAIEAEKNYAWGHGSCVAAGLVSMAWADAALGICEPETAQRIETVVAAHGLPTDTSIPINRLYGRSLSDKKRHGSEMRLVEIHAIGDVHVKQVPLESWRRILKLGCNRSKPGK